MAGGGRILYPLCRTATEAQVGWPGQASASGRTATRLICSGVAGAGKGLTHWAAQPPGSFAVGWLGQAKASGRTATVTQVGWQGQASASPTGPHSHQAHKVVGPQAGIQSRGLGKTSKTVTWPMSVRSG